jgi:hypothetical protein
VDRAQVALAGSTNAYVDIVTRGAPPTLVGGGEGSRSVNNAKQPTFNRFGKLRLDRRQGHFLPCVVNAVITLCMQSHIIVYAFEVYCTTVMVMGSIKCDVRIVQGTTLRRCDP